MSIAKALALALSVAADPAAAVVNDGREASRREPGRAWYLPDQAKLQLAGNIGFVSPGVGWAWRDRGLTADAFLGWVPELLGGDVFSVTAKLTWRPWPVNMGRDLELRLLTVGLQLTYTFGGSYFVDQPSRFPDGYYPFPTALRAGVAFGSAASWRSSRVGKRVGVYCELVALDHMLLAWAKNTGSLSLGDVFSFALGTFVEF